MYLLTFTFTNWFPHLLLEGNVVDVLKNVHNQTHPNSLLFYVVLYPMCL